MAAALLKPFCASLFGVDLSPRMIERARMRVVYEDLTVGELVQYLNERPDYYDLVFSADTLVYFGDLRAFFAAANRSLISRSYLAFSIEHLEETLEGSYVLNSSGRYSHKESYVRSALIDAGFEVKDLRRVVLREELNRPVPGLVVLARLRHIDTSSAKRVKR
jgi:predicted TPR repeat methyltransferase